MQAHTPRRLIAFTRSKVSAGSVGGVRGWGLDPSVVERHIQPAEGGHRRINDGSNLVFG